MSNPSNNPVLDLSFQFALDIVEFCEILENKKKYVVSKQLLKAGTSVGANIHEAQSPESKADFIHKMKVSSKEVKETMFWLNLCKKSKNYPDTQHLIKNAIEIEKILNKIISTAKRNK